MIKVEGWYRTKLIRKDEIVLDTGWNKNQIQDSCYTFLAGLSMGYNFGITAGINYLAFGEGDDSWYGGLPTFGSTISDSAGPYLFIADGYLGFEADGDPTRRWIMDSFGGSFTTDFLVTQLSPLSMPAFNLYFTAYSEAGHFAVRTNTPGAAGSVKYLTAAELLPEVHTTTDLGLDYDVHYGTDGGSGTIVQPTTAIKLYDEIARQEINTYEWKWINWSTLQESAVPTNAVEISIDRGYTESTEVHGEFGLFGAASLTKDSGEMINWVARTTRIDKGPRDVLNTTLRLRFYNS